MSPHAMEQPDAVRCWNLGAAIVHVRRGGDSPVTVRLDGGELEVEVGDDLRVDLTGWAVPVFRGDLDADRVLAPRLGQ